MKLAWLTDIHLNLLDKDQREQFYHSILQTTCDAVLISGDIAEMPSTSDYMKEMTATTKMPIYFILGNHDYYHGVVNDVREVMSRLTKSEKLLHWLPASGMQMLDKNTVLIGQDGWADGRFGDYQNSRVALNDSRMIADLFQENILGRQHLLNKMQQLADDDAIKLQHDLELAVSMNPKKVIVLTHIPPFKEACVFQGKMSGEEWLPYFSSKVMGDVLGQAAKNNTTIEFLVLCGHTHSEAYYQPLGNLYVRTGKAENYRPEVQDVFEI